jgi:hypothetical protein
MVARGVLAKIKINQAMIVSNQIIIRRRLGQFFDSYLTLMIKSA